MVLKFWCLGDCTFKIKSALSTGWLLLFKDHSISDSHHNNTETDVAVSKPMADASTSMRGIAFMAAGMFLFAATDTIAKFLTSDFHPIQIMWSRQSGLILGVLILIAFKGFSIFASSHPRLQIVRGFAAAGSGTLFIFAVAYVPLADAMAVSFVAPFMVTIMGAVFLAEKVGVRRWTAISIGFIGTLIVIRPGLGAMHPAVFLVIIAASLFALRQILSRALNKDKTATTVAYTALVSGALLSIPLPFVWNTPEWDVETMLFVSIACLAATAEICVIKALEYAQAVIVAPVHYSLILWGSLYGFFVFGNFPDYWTWVGAAIITATGIYTLHREHLVAKKRRQDAQEAHDISNNI